MMYLPPASKKAIPDGLSATALAGVMLWGKHEALTAFLGDSVFLEEGRGYRMIGQIFASALETKNRVFYFSVVIASPGRLMGPGYSEVDGRRAASQSSLLDVACSGGLRRIPWKISRLTLTACRFRSALRNPQPYAA